MQQFLWKSNFYVNEIFQQKAYAERWLKKRAFIEIIVRTCIINSKRAD